MRSNYGKGLRNLSIDVKRTCTAGDLHMEHHRGWSVLAEGSECDALRQRFRRGTTAATGSGSTGWRARAARGRSCCKRRSRVCWTVLKRRLAAPGKANAAGALPAKGDWQGVVWGNK